MVRLVWHDACSRVGPRVHFLKGWSQELRKNSLRPHLRPPLVHSWDLTFGMPLIRIGQVIAPVQNLSCLHDFAQLSCIAPKQNSSNP